MLTALIFLNILTLFLLFGVIYLSFKERSKLLDRIMARNYEELISGQKPEENDFSDGQENIVEIEQARDEIIK